MDNGHIITVMKKADLHCKMHALSIQFHKSVHLGVSHLFAMFLLYSHSKSLFYAKLT